jgi:hypothetical protein
MNAAPVPGGRPGAVRALEEFAAAQHGFVTRAQAVRVGVDDVLLLRLVIDGYLDRWEHGVYRFRGTPDLRWADVWVAWLRLDPEHDAVQRARHPNEVTRGPTAAWVYAIGNLQPEPYEFWTAVRRRIRRRDVRLRTGRPPDQDIAVVEGLPLTTPERTVADMVSDGYDLGHVADAIRDAMQRRLLDRAGLVERLGAVIARVLPQRRRASAPALAAQLVEAAG